MVAGSLRASRHVSARVMLVHVATRVRMLEQGDGGDDVRAWQLFLRGQGFLILADGVFGPRTKQATQAFQRRYRLKADGIVGNRTLGRAMMLGFRLIEEERDEREGPGWPPPPTELRSLVGERARERVFGRFAWEPAPTATDPEAIRILGPWVRENIVRVEIPQLVTAKLRAKPYVWVHRLVADPFVSLWRDWEKAGLLARVLSFNGAWVARRIRGGESLSHHAFGSAFDINARFNRLGTIPALVGERGSVRELVPLANARGFFWGGHFRGRLDGMHFELGARVE